MNKEKQEQLKAEISNKNTSLERLETIVEETKTWVIQLMKAGANEKAYQLNAIYCKAKNKVDHILHK